MVAVSGKDHRRSGHGLQTEFLENPGYALAPKPGQTLGSRNV